MGFVEVSSRFPEARKVHDSHHGKHPDRQKQIAAEVHARIDELGLDMDAKSRESSPPAPPETSCHTFKEFLDGYHSRTAAAYKMMEEYKPNIEDLERLAAEGQRGGADLLHTIYSNLMYDTALKSWFDFRHHLYKQALDEAILQRVSKFSAIYDIAADACKRQAFIIKNATSKAKAKKMPPNSFSEIFPELDTPEVYVNLDEKDRKEEAGRWNELETTFRNAHDHFCSANHLKSVIQIAKSNRFLEGNEWDRDDNIIVASNGVVDIASGEMLPGNPSRLVKNSTTVPYPGIDVISALFERFLEEIHDGDAEKIRFLQELYGTAFLAYSPPHIIIETGIGSRGRNGKTVLHEVLGRVLGDYAGPVEPKLLFTSKNVGSPDSHSAGIFQLAGKRYVWASESRQGQAFDVSAVKRFTGGDTLTGRPPYGKHHIKIHPVHSMFLLSNHRPKVVVDDKAFWERAILIRYPFEFVDDPSPSKPFQKKRNPRLKEELLREGPGILAWGLRGAQRFIRNGYRLNIPGSIQKDIAEYRRSEDVLGIWIDEECFTGPDFQAKSSQLYKNYKEWADKSGLKTMSHKTFSTRLQDRGYTKNKTNMGMIFHEIGIRHNGAKGDI